MTSLQAGYGYGSAKNLRLHTNIYKSVADYAANKFDDDTVGTFGAKVSDAVDRQIRNPKKVRYTNLWIGNKKRPL